MNDHRQHIVVLTGAGISAESGLKTFRDADGLWMGYNIEDVATPRAFKKDPALVLDFYNMRRRDVKNAEPNEAHRDLAELEKNYKVTIITQNIDDLHERGGSTNVVHLHGQIFQMRTVGNEYDLLRIEGDILPGDNGPDGTQLRPHIVWFEEPVPMIEEAARIIQTADIFVLIGTSLQVYPAAALIHAVPQQAPKYIIDKVIPQLPANHNFIAIEKPATEGMKFLKALLS